MADVTLIILKNPFNISDREIKKMAYIPKKTLMEYAQPFVMGLDLEELVFSSNGVIVNQDQLNSLIVKSGDYMAICSVVGKGSGGKNILRMIATVALMAYTGNIAAGHGWGATLGGAGSWGASLAAGAIGAIGGMLINHMFPQPIPELSSADMATSTPTYSWGSLQSLSGQGNALAVTYGTMRTAGQILAQHITNGDGDKQYLNLLLCGGEGPIENITDIKINDNPIANYHDVTMEMRLGTNDQSPILNFNDTYADQELSYELVLGNDWSTHQTEGNGGEGLEITFECPNGLYYANDQGGLDNATVKLQGQYRKVGALDWISWDEWTITAAKNSAVRKVCRIDKLPAGKYEVRCKCKSKSGESPRYCTKVYWTQLSHIIHEDFSRPGKVLLGIKALATDQLSGGLPTVTWLQSVENVNVYNPLVGAYEQKSARNAAWAAYDLLHRCKKLKNSKNGIDEYIVYGILADRIDYQSFVDWASFCTERNLNFEYIFDAASDLWSSLQKPESVGRGKVILKGTRYSCVCDRPSQPVQLFTMGNMVQDKFQEDFLSVKDRANAIELSFINKEKGYQKDTLTIYGDDWDSSHIIQNPTQITLYGCTSYQQAYQEGKYRLLLNQYLQRTISFDADIDAIACQVGDVILIQHDVPQWGYGGRILSATENTIQFDCNVSMDEGNEYSVMVRLTDDTLVEKQVIGVAEDTVTIATPFSTIPQRGDVFSFGESNKITKPFRVLNITRSQEFKRSITALEYVEGVYAEAENIPVIPYSDLDVASFEVINLDVREVTFRQKDGNIVSQLECSWELPRGKVADRFEIRYSYDNGGSWVFHNSTSANICIIPNIQTGKSYIVKISTVKNRIISNGITSNTIFINGKDSPPSDVAKLVLSQTGVNLRASFTLVSDPDIKYYELRMGATWENSCLIKILSDTEYIFEAPDEGTLTFHIKAVDRSGNYSEHAAKAVVNVLGLPPKNIILEVNSDIDKWQTSGMSRDFKGRWKISSINKLCDYKEFAEIFGMPEQLQKVSEVILPIIDLGENFVNDSSFYTDPWGNIKVKSIEELGDYEKFVDIFGVNIHLQSIQYETQTFVAVNVDYKQVIMNSLGIEYRTSIDSLNFSDWISSTNKQFFGRYIQIRLLPKSIDGVTNVVISAARTTIDVPDVEEIIENITIPEQKTHISFKRKFSTEPKSIAPFTQDSVGRQATWKLSNITKEGFDIEILDADGNLISGKLNKAIIRGY